MKNKLEDVLKISRSLILLENEEKEIKAKIAAAREQLASLVGEGRKPTTHKRTHVRTAPLPKEKTTGLDPSLGDYGAKGGYGQRGVTGEVLAFMKSVPNQIVSPDVVVKELNRPGKNEVFSKILQRLAMSGQIERTHRGLYRFVPPK